jgi:hypothetical protein
VYVVRYVVEESLWLLLIDAEYSSSRTGDFGVDDASTKMGWE